MILPFYVDLIFWKNMKIQFKIMMTIGLFYNVIFTRDSIMSYEEYVQIKHNSPYMYALIKPDHALFYFGANHSCDPENEQYSDFDCFWNDFLQCTNYEDCVVLIEGSLRGQYKTKYDAITKAGGEGGLLQFYAGQHQFTIICPEPDEQFLKKELLKYYSYNEIAYRDFAHICMQFHRYCNLDVKLELETFYQKYAPTLTLDQMKEIYTQIFGTQFDISDEQFFYDVSNPVNSKTVINKVCRKASQIRDEAIVICIADLIKQKKNIFIAYGWTHAVMQEAAIRSLWNEENN